MREEQQLIKNKLLKMNLASLNDNSRSIYKNRDSKAS
jgi:hypothetical protein